MGEEKKYTKTKIFLFLIFAVFLIIFFSSTVSLMQKMFRNISEKNSELKCNDFIYSIKGENLNGKLFLTLTNNDYDTNITKITLISDNSEEEHIEEITPNLESAEQKSIIINDFMFDKGVYIYANDCINKKEYIMLRE